MTIAIGSDHAGFKLKTDLIEYFQQHSIKYLDCGTFDTNRVDYPDFALKVAEAVTDHRCEKGVMICGTGIGISITANKIAGIRAALCCSEYMAEMARKHNDANLLAMGGRTTSPELALKILETFLHTDFEGGRHQIRVDKIHSLTGR
ncbi:ribose 5-phosphate isomerase B [candidate division KSB1 bacterium]|nr:ribose 5-phosphate isomerase B [candidate division KSB1 bacterium]